MEHIPRSGLIWSGSTTVRARPLPGQEGKGLLLITGSHGTHLSLPETDTLADWLDTLREWGYTHIRTSALSPAVADRLHDIGFTTIQDLVLMHRNLSQPHTPLTRATGISSLRLQPRFPRWKQEDVDTLLMIDKESFGEEWCMDALAFREALSATRRTKIFVKRANGVIQGFIIVGVTANNAFIQRLAVHTESRRSGVAAQLLDIALQWVQRKRCTRVVVNTEIVNHAAIALYSRFDFKNMEHGLEVLERALA